MADLERPEHHGRTLLTAILVFSVILTAAWLCFLGYGLAWMIEYAIKVTQQKTEQN
jgi:hypothetical protein